MSIHIRSIVRSAALSFALFALAACGGSGGGGDSSSSSAPPAPSTAARKVVLEVGSEECQYGGILVQTGIDDNRNGALDDDEVDTSEAVCNGAVGPQGDPGVDGTATVIIYFELGQTFTLSEDAAVGDSAGTITAFTSNGTDVTFTEADSSSDAFDVSDAGEITLAADVTLDFETQNEYVIAVVATATAAPPAHFSVRIAITDVDETPFQNGTAEHPYLVDSLAELQSIGSGFSSDDEGVVAPADATASLNSHYRQTADIDASSSANFQPIGGTFGGSYDGGGYLISGLVINRGSTANVGLFSQTSSDSVLENVALVGADVTGQDSTGVLVGLAAGTVRQSFASGLLQGRLNGGGLVGTNAGPVEDSFATVTVAGTSNTGGLVGSNTGSMLRSFALGSVSVTGTTAGGLGGIISGPLSHSFATGDVTGSFTGGLTGSSGISVADSYATGSVGSGGLVGSGSGAARSYRVDDPAGGTTDGALITLAGLRALACDQDNDGFVADTNDAIFEDDDGNTCDASNEDVFPWDFGTDADLPVINGLVGGLDAQGQRLAVEFSMVDRTLTGTAIVAPFILPREAGSTLSYYWVLPSGVTAVGRNRVGDVLGITAAAAEYDLHLTIVERDAAETILAVYADEFTLTVN